MGVFETIFWIMYGTVTMGAFLAWYGRADDGVNEFPFCALIGFIGALLWPFFFSVWIYEGLESFLRGMRDV